MESALPSFVGTARLLIHLIVGVQMLLIHHLEVVSGEAAVVVVVVVDPVVVQAVQVAGQDLVALGGDQDQVQEEEDLADQGVLIQVSPDVCNRNVGMILDLMRSIVPVLLDQLNLLLIETVTLMSKLDRFLSHIMLKYLQDQLILSFNT